MQKSVTRALCHPRNSWLLNKDITLNLHPADQNLFNNGHFAYNYEWKCKNNVVSMKSDYLICRTQHHISIETVKRYMTQIENLLTAPCWHHVWRESAYCKALWVNMAALCAKRPQSQNRHLSPGSAIVRSLRTDKRKTWNFQLKKKKKNNEPNPKLYYHCFRLNTNFSNSFFVSPPTSPQWIVAD